MQRERLVTDTFVDLADTLASDYDVGAFLHTLVERCRTIFSVRTSGVLVENPDGVLELAAASSEEMEHLERAELDGREGPCFDAYRKVEQVVAGDLRQEHDRWPHVVPRALDMGLLAAFAFPLRLRGDCIGAMNLYRDRTGRFDDENIRLGQAFADVAAIGILQQRKVAAAEQRAEQLQHALNSRVIIEQAKGVLRERHGVTVEDAFLALRRESRTSNRKLYDVCRDVIDGAPVDGFS